MVLCREIHGDRIGSVLYVGGSGYYPIERGTWGVGELWKMRNYYGVLCPVRSTATLFSTDRGSILRRFWQYTIMGDGKGATTSPSYQQEQTTHILRTVESTVDNVTLAKQTNNKSAKQEKKNVPSTPTNHNQLNAPCGHRGTSRAIIAHNGFPQTHSNMNYYRSLRWYSWLQQCHKRPDRKRAHYFNS